MKHATKERESSVKPKAKTSNQIRAIKKTKFIEKKPIGKADLKSRQQTLVKKVKLAAKKSAPTISTRVEKPAAKKTAPKLSAKNGTTLKPLTSVQKAKSTVKKTAPIVSKSSVKQSAKKVAPKITAKRAKTQVVKTKPISSAKKTAPVGKKIKSTAARNIKPKTATIKTKVFGKGSAKPTAKKTFKTVKPHLSKVKVQAAKSQKLAAKVVISKTKKNAEKAAKPIASPTMAAAAKNKAKRIVSVEPVIEKRKKIEPTIVAKKLKRKTEKVKPTVTAKEAKSKTQKAKPTILAKIVKKDVGKIKTAAPTRKIKTVKNDLKAVSLPVTKKPKDKRAKPISSAVFRGKKDRYDFKVFALNEKFEAIPAVYVISKRKIDKRKKGHHALICIGATDSIFDELRKHKKGKCVKKYEANVVSILPEADEKKRLKIETDLKAAHSIPCVHT